MIKPYLHGLIGTPSLLADKSCFMTNIEKAKIRQCMDKSNIEY